MDNIGKPEIATQRRVIDLFCNELGYQYLGDWKDRQENSNIEEDLLADYLLQCGQYSQAQVNAAIYGLKKEAGKTKGYFPKWTKQVFKITEISNNGFKIKDGKSKVYIRSELLKV